MSEGADVDELRRLLGRRVDLIEVLLEGPVEKRVLNQELPIARSTVDRAVRQLESKGLVRRAGGTVQATLTCRLAYESFQAFSEEVATLTRFSDLLAELPPSAGVPYDLLRGASAYRSEPPATGRPSNKVLSLWREANRIRGCASVINDSTAVEVYMRMITEREGHGALVLTADLAEHVRDQYFQTVHEQVSTGRFRIYEIETLPYELFLVDNDDETHVIVMIYGETNSLQGALVNDTDAAVAWGEATFEDFREAATEFTDDFRVSEPSESSE